MSTNGLGWPIEAAFDERRRIERLYRLVPDEPGIYEKWRALVDEHRVAGRQVFDARLVAIMLIAKIDVWAKLGIFVLEEDGLEGGKYRCDRFDG